MSRCGRWGAWACILALLAILAGQAPAGLISMSGGTGVAVPEVDPGGGESPLIAGVMIEDFENGFRDMGTGNPSGKNFFNYAGGGDTSIVDDTTATFLEGSTKALESYFTTGDHVQIYFPHTVTEGLSPCWSTYWHYLRRFAENPPGGCSGDETWTTNGYNRLRFWVKLPAGYSLPSVGHNSIEFGTFLKEQEDLSGGSDDGGGHFYHEYAFKSCDCWQQVIIDYHPQHIRGAAGSFEVGLITDFYDDGRNYLETMVSMYFDFVDGGIPNEEMRFKNMEVYNDPDTSDEALYWISSLTGFFLGDTGELLVAWNHAQDDASDHDVRYAFSDIHTLGWSNATVAGTTEGDGEAYTQRYFNTTGIDEGSNDWIYVAVKADAAATDADFHQIILPVQ